MQLGFDTVLTPQLWERIDVEDPRARELADNHYSRRTPGADGIMGPGRRFLFGHEVTIERVGAIWGVCYAMDPGPGQRYQFRNAIFRNESATQSSSLIVAATALTYDVFKIRYGALPAEPLTSEIDIEATRARRGRERPPGYCYECAGWTWVRSTLPGHGRGAKAVYAADFAAWAEWAATQTDPPAYKLD